jgi:hypothetical protein
MNYTWGTTRLPPVKGSWDIVLTKILATTGKSQRGMHIILTPPHYCGSYLE